MNWNHKESTNRKISHSLLVLLLCESSQVFFHVPVPDAIYYLVLSAIEDEFSGDRAVEVLCQGTFFFIGQMTVLIWDSFLAALDLENICPVWMLVAKVEISVFFAFGNSIFSAFSSFRCFI